MIDPKRLRELCEVGGGREVIEAVLLLTCPDPLTLDAAVQVMGREPDSRSMDEWMWWESEAVQVTDRGPGYVSGIVGAWKMRNPTVGQFACLVAGARQGASDA